MIVVMLGVGVGHRKSLRQFVVLGAVARASAADSLRLALAHPIHGVGQRNRIQTVVLGVLDDLRIDEEHHRHLAPLAGLEALLGEAEAVDLGEVGADGRRRHVVGRVADDLLRGFVDHDVVHGQHVADPDLDEVLLRHEAPGQPAGHIGVEPHDDLAVEHIGGRGAGLHRRAGKPGGAAEPVVERHRRERHAHHPGREHAARGRDQEIAPASGVFGWLGSGHRVFTAGGSGSPVP